MNRIVILGVFLAVPMILLAQPSREKIAARFGVDADIDKYPQHSPKDALRSVVKAIEAKRFDYLLAHLSDPAFVDGKVKAADGKFDVVVQQTTKYFDNDPERIRDLRKFLSDGVFPEVQGDTVEVKCTEIRGQRLFMKKVGSRWFLEDRIRPEKEKDKE